MFIPLNRPNAGAPPPMFTARARKEIASQLQSIQDTNTSSGASIPKLRLYRSKQKIAAPQPVDAPPFADNSARASTSGVQILEEEPHLELRRSTSNSSISSKSTITSIKTITPSSNDDSISEIHPPVSTQSQKSKIFGLSTLSLRRMGSNKSQEFVNRPSSESLVSPSDNSFLSRTSTTSTEQSSYYENSLFSSNDRESLSTVSTGSSFQHPQQIQQQYQQQNRKQPQYINESYNEMYSAESSVAPLVSLEDVIPTSFADMYTEEIITNPQLLLPNGRPAFTQRDLVDWQINDIRSLLIVDKLKPEWNGHIPIVYQPPGFRVIHLPLDATDNQIIQTLVTSGIYKEQQFDEKFLIQTAKYTVQAARLRHIMLEKQRRKLLQRDRENDPNAMIIDDEDDACGENDSLLLPDSLEASRILSKPEWRNIIENYLLNLGCEAQTRTEFKMACKQAKQEKEKILGIQSSSHHMEPPSMKSVHKIHPSKFLLRKALLSKSRSAPIPPPTMNKQKVTLSKTEKQQIWTHIQSNIYGRLGLNWSPDRT